VGQLVASGVDTNCDNPTQAEWIITKKSPGKPFMDTSVFKAAKSDRNKCEAALKTAIESVKRAHAKFFKDTRGFNHEDLVLENILFSDDLQTAFLIDFGRAAKDGVVSFIQSLRLNAHTSTDVRSSLG